jgi:hypothetical protein
MDWEENLAAIIRCTDENLQRQFETMGDFASIDSIRGSSRRRMRMNDATSSNNSNNFFIRPLFQSNMESAQEWREKERSNQFAKEMHQEFETFDQEAYKKEEAKPIPSTMPFQTQTYDIPQMMEQVRMSIKLEVDARAAIAERQLSSIMQLCKSTSEELDRVRVEVCSNDRQLHSLEQTQSKIRQDLTTQKDIGFHLQSLCGKDESWRIQADNQLLELRQMVAALREQGNGIQISLQEKLSRAELLVHFNAAMEPIKAQVNANIQHQGEYYRIIILGSTDVHELYLYSSTDW